KTNMAALKKKIKKIAVKKKKVKTVKRKAAVKKPLGKTKKKISTLDLRRSDKNPIIEPENNLSWESKATFNPTAFQHDGKVHIVYRAIGDSDNSVLGYVTSQDGFSVSERSPTPIYSHFLGQNRDQSLPPILYGSGGGWGGGCEDPRLTLLDNRVYMLYTAFDGWGSVRIALTSISLDDFISKRWNWKKPVLISPPNEIHKNWVLFPEKISGSASGGKGKYAILHSISPHIMIDYFDSLDELDGNNFIHSVHQNSLLWGSRDRLIRGVGPSPIKTKYGWLILYHKMEKHDSHRYKLWAMILDAKNPAKILYNSSQPILEPDEWYENEGYKNGVVYACGAIVKDGELFVYYGGADKVSCVATANLDEFLKELVHSSVSKLKNKKIKA
ncbi:MAG: hypothetical protein UU58_C0012G0011, partial [Candidatus Nomurabacteria bacterium GW2011_GWA2_41_25]